MIIPPIKRPINKIIEVPSDKSITHRAMIISSIAEGKSTIFNPLECYDTHNTLKCMEKLGARIEKKEDKIIIHGIKKLNSSQLDVGNSGTTLRLLTGLLSGYEGEKFILDGDESIRKRPMQRVIEPLACMGAKIAGNNGNAPVIVYGKKLKGIDYNLEIPSAQLKSAILLAGLNASEKTTIVEKNPSRNHTELMLAAFGAGIKHGGHHNHHENIELVPSALKGRKIKIGGDFSSGAFFLVLGALLKNSYLKIENAGFNPTRTGMWNVLRKCGANTGFTKLRSDNGEAYADIEIEGGNVLKPFYIKTEQIPLLIDEIPILCVLACFIEGESIIEGCGELKYKESNRLIAICEELSKLGADIEILGSMRDIIRIRGKGFLKGGQVFSHGDHRIAMALSIALSLSQKGGEVLGSDCVGVSFPNFFETLRGLTK
ncbi:MAG: 3-phosphoshikimate 1-carboxyvinyltransferase [Firmicutes bacterium]|nr:3-phosphoshikimate 1-carboxyvinyltransferase [Bacillota bacterium]